MLHRIVLVLLIFVSISFARADVVKTTDGRTVEGKVVEQTPGPDGHVTIALGASRAEILRMVLARGALLVLCGIALGMSGAFAVTRLMASLLYGVTATDAVTFAAVSLLLGLTSLAAIYIPASRAIRLDPTLALRHE
jgi:hypothetical protein